MGVPNILSNVVTRHADGSVTIEQSSLISRRLNLVTEMTLDVVADDEKRSLVLTRTSGHGFLEFVGSYTLKPQGTAPRTCSTWWSWCRAPSFRCTSSRRRFGRRFRRCCSQLGMRIGGGAVAVELLVRI